MVLAKRFRQVCAFEPLVDHIDCFYKNLEGATNVVLYPVALGSETGVAGFVPVAENSGNSHMKMYGYADVMVNVYRLDDYAANIQQGPCSFMKIDVEGYEVEVVEGAMDFIQRHRPVMVVEQKPGNAERYGGRSGEVIDTLVSWGAKVQWHKNGDYCLTWG